MRSFLGKCILFLVPAAIIFGLAEIFLRAVPTSYRIKDEQLNADASHIEVLILGNSHATYGLDPRVFSLDAFNIASVNQSLYFDKRIMLKYLGRLTNLKYVLVSVDYHSLYYSDEGARNVWSYYGYGIDYKNRISAAVRHCYLYGYEGPLALEFLKRPFENKYRRIRSVDVDYDLDLRQPYKKGYVGKIGGPFLSKDQNRERADYFNKIVHTSREHDSILADLEGLIDTLKKKISPPSSSRFHAFARLKCCWTSGSSPKIKPTSGRFAKPGMCPIGTTLPCRWTAATSTMPTT
ncbi:MAG TPA: hypothetical protein VGR89_03635 [Puia sp.]|nr:hypothetical protein [Puia sp.]